MSEKPADKPRKSRKKLILRILGGVVFLLLFVLVIGRALLPGIIKGQIESQSTAMLGTEVTVEDVDLSVLGGAATIQGFRIANPEGFSGSPLFLCQSMSANISLTSLMSELITVEEVAIRGPVVSLEADQAGRQNWRVVMETLQEKFPREEVPDEEPTGPASPSEVTAGFLLERLLVEEASVHFSDSKSGDASIVLQSFEVRNVGMPMVGEELPNGIMTATLDGLTIGLSGKDSGFENPQVFSLGNVAMDFDLGTFFKSAARPQIVVPRLAASGIEAVVEMTGGPEDEPGSNAAALGAIVQAVMATEESGTTEAEEESSGFASRLQSGTELLREQMDSEEESLRDPSAEGQESAFDFFLLSELEIKEISFRYIDRPEPDHSVTVYDTEVLGSALRYPPFEGSNSAELWLRAHPVSRDSKVVVEAKGDFMKTEGIRDLELHAAAYGQQLSPLDAFKEGLADANLDLSIAGGEAEGRLTFKLYEFDLAKSDNIAMQLAVLTPLKVLEKTDVPSVKIPFGFQVEEGTWPEIGNKSVKGVRTNLKPALSGTVDILRKKLEELNITGELKNQGKEVIESLKDIDTDSLKDKADDLKGTVEDVGGKIKNIFGGDDD